MRKNMTRGSLARGIELVDSAVDTDASGNVSMDITSVDFSGNDLGVFVAVSDEYDASSAVSGWVEVFDSGDGDPHSVVFTRRLDGSETAIVSTGTEDWSATSMFFGAFRNSDNPTGADVTSNATADDGNNSDCPATAYAVVSSDMVLAIHTGGDYVTLTVPTGHTEINKVSYSPGDASSVGVTYETDVSGTKTPGLFGGTTSDVSHKWGVTIVLNKA